MGIPSYYRRLVGSIGGLLYNTKPGTLVASGAHQLLMDFNCLIYHVLRDPKRAPYPGSDGFERRCWIDRLYDDIVRYTMNVIRGAGAERVFIAIDGVVPMAKIRQQRMRRFKSAATTAAEPAFDSNAITPGTAFMTGLRTRLEEMICDENKCDKWILSSADEPGEGEHKLLAELRANASLNEANKPYIVYGLDGDLIVLLLWTQALGITGSAPIWLYRENVDNEAESVAETTYSWFSIDRLRDYLRDSEGVHIGDYCAAMMLLGNDFLPTSITFKIKDGGHNFLLGWLKTSLQRGERFLTNDNRLKMETWRRLFKQLAAVEERRFLEAIQKKWRGVIADSENEKPMIWRQEKAFLKNPDALADELQLRADWRSIYARKAFHATAGAEEATIKGAITAYYDSMNWIVDYYVGRPVSDSWTYSWLLPPLWEDIYAAVPKTRGASAGPCVEQVPLRPQEQLALVLPASSWNLIPAEDPASKFLAAAPEFFPVHFEYESIGKRYTWEVEPAIPIPSIEQLRAILNT